MDWQCQFAAQVKQDVFMDLYSVFARVDRLFEMIVRVFLVLFGKSLAVGKKEGMHIV